MNENEIKLELNGGETPPMPATLADGPAPAAPTPPIMDPPPTAPAYGPVGQKPLQEAPEKPAKPAVRRVGTFTLGTALILTGLCITMSYLLPSFDIATVAKLAPLVLVALGAEILWASARKGDARLKYDFLSMFTCFILICGSLAAACVPVLWKYYGPDRDYTESRLANEISDTLYPQLSGLGVSNCNIWIILGRSEFDKNMTVNDLTAQDSVRATVTLSGSFTTTEEFTAAAARILPILHENKVTYASLSAESDTDRWELSAGNQYSMNAAATDLTAAVTHEIMVTDADGDRYWYDAQAWANKQAYEDEMRQQMLQENLNDESYRQGYQAALNEHGLDSDTAPAAERTDMTDGLDSAA